MYWLPKFEIIGIYSNGEWWVFTVFVTECFLACYCIRQIKIQVGNKIMGFQKPIGEVSIEKQEWYILLI